MKLQNREHYSYLDCIDLYVVQLIILGESSFFFWKIKLPNFHFANRNQLQDQAEAVPNLSTTIRKKEKNYLPQIHHNMTSITNKSKTMLSQP